ncbi:Uncharacterised protein [Ectopseudomonas mendocina]|uniref:Uncharacterized protein n=1 Tax=Ectopseudomonas mendocina TaxID=300 RepID=A0A379PNA8_ECTME|nr:hypothetical protein [Pseudomonas mendocina]SUE95815.1 Uncharacterised protein [Pseudomonas mendocina]
MFKGWFLINDCIKVSYKEVPVKRLKFTIEHVGIKRPQFEIVVRLIGDIPVTITAKEFAGLGEAEMTAAMMLCNVATQLALVIKYRLYGDYLSDPGNFVWGSSSDIEKTAHTLFYAASRDIPEDYRIPMPRRVHERVNRHWLKGRAEETSESKLGLIEQPEPICPLIESSVWDPERREEIIGLVHQLRDWGQSWKNLAKRLIGSNM